MRDNLRRISRFVLGQALLNNMNILVSIFGFLFMTMCVFGVIAPVTFQGQVARFKGKSGLKGAIIGRGATGVLFIVASPACRDSNFFLFFGVFLLAAVVFIVLLGRESFEGLLDWWTKLNPIIVRTWALCAVFFAGYIIYASGWPPI